MDTTVWIVIAVALVLVFALALALVRARRGRTTQLRERFGDEYDRRVEDTGSERQARKDLTEVRDRREQLQIRPLAPAARERYVQRWQTVQADFVDRPGHAVDQADEIVKDVMHERGYPVDDVGTRADMVAADHPEVSGDYRAAADARRRHHEAADGASTEELRRAMVHYRSLFERMVGDPGDGGDRRPEQAEDVDLRTDEASADRKRGRHAE